MKNRILELREARGWTQVQLAEKIGCGWQTISRLENAHNRITEKREIALADAFGIEADQLYLAPAARAGLRSVVVRQQVKAGLFAESLVWDQDDTYEVAVPDDATTRTIDLYGAEVAGRSMNLIYPEKTVLVYSPFGGGLEVGKRYIVERIRVDGLRESTVKTLHSDSNGEMWLIPESTDPEFRPVRLDGDGAETVRIVGRVRYAVIPQ